MPFKAPERSLCPKCGKPVYAAEERVGAGEKWHKMCFMCGMCNKMLDSTTVAGHEGRVYCKGCHGRKFGPKGYGFGGGSGALSMDTGKQFGGTESEMSNRPTDSHVGPSSTGGTGGTGPRCPRCGKAVYDAERAIGVTTPWHKTCFNCKQCHKSLDSTNMAAKDEEVYCKGCYGKNFGPSGYGFGQGAGTLSMA